MITMTTIRKSRRAAYGHRARHRPAGDAHLAVSALALSMDAKHPSTGAHQRRTQALGRRLAGVLRPGSMHDAQLRYAFLLHDIGKLLVPTAILDKPGRLTETEWSTMCRHPESGVRVLAPMRFLDPALDIVLHHHERWDGGGYPGGLAGEEIPWGARVLAVADAVDAMIEDRPYREPLTIAEARREIANGAGTQFDPACAAALERLRDADLMLAGRSRHHTGRSARPASTTALTGPRRRAG